MNLPEIMYSGPFVVCAILNMTRMSFDCYDDAHRMHCQRTYKAECLHSAVAMNTVAIFEGYRLWQTTVLNGH